MLPCFAMAACMARTRHMSAGISTIRSIHEPSGYIYMQSNISARNRPPPPKNNYLLPPKQLNPRAHEICLLTPRHSPEHPMLAGRGVVDSLTAQAGHPFLFLLLCASAIALSDCSPKPMPYSEYKLCGWLHILELKNEKIRKTGSNSPERVSNASNCSAASNMTALFNIYSPYCRCTWSMTQKDICTADVVRLTHKGAWRLLVQA